MGISGTQNANRPEFSVERGGPPGPRPVHPTQDPEKKASLSIGLGLYEGLPDDFPTPSSQSSLFHQAPNNYPREDGSRANGASYPQPTSSSGPGLDQFIDYGSSYPTADPTPNSQYSLSTAPYSFPYANFADSGVSGEPSGAFNDYDPRRQWEYAINQSSEPNHTHSGARHDLFGSPDLISNGSTSAHPHRASEIRPSSDSKRASSKKAKDLSARGSPPRTQGTWPAGAASVRRAGDGDEPEAQGRQIGRDNRPLESTFGPSGRPAYPPSVGHSHGTQHQLGFAPSPSDHPAQFPSMDVSGVAYGFWGPMASGAQSFDTSDPAMSFLWDASSSGGTPWPTPFPIPQHDLTFSGLSSPEFSFKSPSADFTTISPTQFAPFSSNNDGVVSWNELLMKSRASSSSVSSDTHEGYPSFEELARLMQQASLPSTNPPPRTTSSTGSADIHMSPSTSSRISPINSITSNGTSANHAMSNTAPAFKSLTEALPEYITSPNRLAFGERRIVISTPKVAQKSYGTEKRYICPHPQATLIGQSWWSHAKDDCPVSPLLPPRVDIGLAGEPVQPPSSSAWLALDGRTLDERGTTPVTDDDHPFLGRAFGKSLHISEAQGQKRELFATVTIKAPLKHHAGPNGWGTEKGSLVDISNDEILGKFDSKEIRIISKPSKKKSTTKSTDREWLATISTGPSLMPQLLCSTVRQSLYSTGQRRRAHRPVFSALPPI